MTSIALRSARMGKLSQVAAQTTPSVSGMSIQLLKSKKSQGIRLSIAWRSVRMDKLSQVGVGTTPSVSGMLTLPLKSKKSQGIQIGS